MFLASDSRERRESRVRSFLASDPGISLLLAAVNFEWTVCRAVLFLSKRPNSELRLMMGNYYSLDAYKDLWKSEISAGSNFDSLATVVRNWSSLREAFGARNRLVHGRYRYTKNMAAPCYAQLDMWMTTAACWAVRSWAACQYVGDPSVIKKSPWPTNSVLGIPRRCRAKIDVARRVVENPMIQNRAAFFVNEAWPLRVTF
jgi:hypothetical protein